MSNHFFFFSSRRRHTRSLRDWSSDVCSSDLVTPGAFTAEQVTFNGTGTTRFVFNGVNAPGVTVNEVQTITNVGNAAGSFILVYKGAQTIRSEERRVGKEWRSRREQ